MSTLTFWDAVNAILTKIEKGTVEKTMEAAAMGSTLMKKLEANGAPAPPSFKVGDWVRVRCVGKWRGMVLRIAEQSYPYWAVRSGDYFLPDELEPWVPRPGERVRCILPPRVGHELTVTESEPCDPRYVEPVVDDKCRPVIAREAPKPAVERCTCGAPIYEGLFSRSCGDGTHRGAETFVRRPELEPYPRIEKHWMRTNKPTPEAAARGAKSWRGSCPENAPGVEPFFVANEIVSLIIGEGADSVRYTDAITVEAPSYALALAKWRAAYRKWRNEKERQT